MNVSDVMSTEPRAVSVMDRLDEAARILWEQDCGFVPVVDGTNTLVGVLTDRDLCMASYTQASAVANVPVRAVMARELTTCRPEDPLATAMAAMAAAQVHRLPVVDARGALVGVLSSSDLMQLATARPAAVIAAKVLATVAAITRPRSGGRDSVAEAKTAPPKRRTAKKRVAKKPVAKKPVAKKPVAKKPVAKKPVTKKPVAKKAAKAAARPSKARAKR